MGSLDLCQHIAPELLDHLRKHYGLSVVDMNTENGRLGVLHFMDQQFESNPETRAFMERLCRNDSPEAAARGRELIQGVFLEEARRHGCVLETGNGSPTAQSWWTLEDPLTFSAAIALTWEFFTDIFWKGKEATGWRGVPYGIRLLLSSKMAVPTDADGTEVQHLMFQNIGTIQGERKHGHASAHLLVGVAASEALGIPLKAQLQNRRHLKPLVEIAGFEDMGPIMTPEEKYPFYHWAVRWPTGQQITARELELLSQLG
jgi:hypothetical protein